MNVLLVFHLLCLIFYFDDIVCEDLHQIKPVIVLHGGAGDIPEERVQGKLKGLKAAVRAGYQQLIKSNALDAVEAAVVSMENDDFFNAGYGSVLNIRGEVEMDASIMSGEDLDVGAVTLINEFQNPISIARKVLSDSPHSMLSGEGVKLFALEKGFKTVPPESLISEFAKQSLERYIQEGHCEKMKYGGVGTVGAVAIDAKGHIAVATSTGGFVCKAVGRIAGATIIGSGSYADDRIGGVSLSGHGESFIKYCLAHTIIKLLESGRDAYVATKQAIDEMTERLNNTINSKIPYNSVAGGITLSRNGDVGIYYNTKSMTWGYVKDNKLKYGFDEERIFEENI